jgi:hypothetical protein
MLEKAVNDILLGHASWAMRCSFAIFCLPSCWVLPWIFTLKLRQLPTFAWLDATAYLALKPLLTKRHTRRAWPQQTLRHGLQFTIHAPRHTIDPIACLRSATIQGASQPQLIFRFSIIFPVSQACLRSQASKISTTASCSLRSTNLSPAITIAIAA